MYIYLFPRFLEHFILNGPYPDALDSVLSQLSDPNRKQPQDLDKAVIGMWGLQHCCFSTPKSWDWVMGLKGLPFLFLCKFNTLNSYYVCNNLLLLSSI